MVRFAGLLSLAALAGLAGCDPGSLDQFSSADGGPCKPTELANGDGHHHSGEDCIVDGCHSGNGGPVYTIGGTLFDISRGGSPVGGATVVVTDGNGMRLNLVTGSNGNFFSDQPVTYPLLVEASQCPHVNHMVSLSNQGGCNQGGCHGSLDIRVALEGR